MKSAKPGVALTLECERMMCEVWREKVAGAATLAGIIEIIQADLSYIQQAKVELCILLKSRMYENLDLRADEIVELLQLATVVFHTSHPLKDE